MTVSARDTAISAVAVEVQRNQIAVALNDAIGDRVVCDHVLRSLEKLITLARADGALHAYSRLQEESQ